MAINVSGFIPDTTPNPALGQIANTITENKRYKEERDYRQQKNEEADQWKKLGLIQDLTDLSKHQTGSDVANAIGNQQASQILQKYTQAAKTMSPEELMYNVQKDMSATVGGMDAMKAELDLSDEQLKILKTKFPELDISTIAKEYRTDILNRRINNDNGFNNPLEVGKSSMQLDNPEFLSRYMTGNKNLSESIINPKGVDESSVFMGTPDSHTTYTAKVPFWKKPNFDPLTLSKGFLTTKGEPSLEIKGETLPSDALPSSNGKPFKIIDKDVYDRFANDGKTNLELIAAARKEFPGYDNFTPTEKELAKRNILYRNIESLDQTNFHPTSSTKPSRISVSSGGNTKPVTPINLSEFPEEPSGGRNITDITDGITFSDIMGSKFNAKKVVYYPSSQKVRVTQYMSKDSDGNPTGEKTKDYSLDTYIQIIKNKNPQTDIKNIEALRKSTQIPKSTSGMIKVVLSNGKVGEIPSDKVDQFLKENKDSKRQ